MALSSPFTSDACSRVLYLGDDNLFVVGRSLDWKTPIPTNIYVYPRGMAKQSSNLPGAISWVSQYGAVYAVSYDGGVTEGMNECGLVINGLFCKGTVYDNAETAKLPPMSLAVFVEWLLDMNQTTDEVAEVIRAHNFSLSGASFDQGTVAALHWGVTDATGNSIIFEFDHGNVNIYPMGDYLAMTNDPTWPSMRAIIDYWEGIGGQHMLPGTVSSPSRAVRGNYFAHHVKKTADPDLAVSITRSILANVSVPYTYEIPGSAELSSTQWRSFADLKNRRYYFDLVTNLGVIYIDLTKLDLYPGAPVLRLEPASVPNHAGCANDLLKRHEPFTPMY